MALLCLQRAVLDVSYSAAVAMGLPLSPVLACDKCSAMIGSSVQQVCEGIGFVWCNK
jgi:hypothetical protein